MTSSTFSRKPAMLRAIQTRYDGHYFRSRQEARFAVLLNQLGIRYRYEVEGYWISQTEKYLPDFWLPDLQVFVEIKGKHPNDEEFAKVSSLVRVSKHPALIFWGEFRLSEFVENNYALWENTNGVFRSVRGIAALMLHEQIAKNKLGTALIAARQARFEFNSA